MNSTLDWIKEISWANPLIRETSRAPPGVNPPDHRWGWVSFRVSRLKSTRNFFGQRKTKAICIVRGLNIDLRYVCPALFWNGSLRTSRRSCAIFERTMHSLGVHNHSIGLLELGLALMQAHMTQKPMLKIAKAIVQRADKIKLHTGHVHIHY